MKTGISRDAIKKTWPEENPGHWLKLKCEATISQKGIWRSREVPIHILQDGLLPETIQGSKGAFKNKRGTSVVKLGLDGETSLKDA